MGGKDLLDWRLGGAVVRIVCWSSHYFVFVGKGLLERVCNAINGHVIHLRFICM